MKKLIAIASVSTATIMSSFSASNEDYYNVTSDEEADLLKKANETTVYSRPFIDKRKIFVAEGGYDEEIAKKEYRPFWRNQNGQQTIHFQIPSNGNSKICAVRDGTVVNVIQNKDNCNKGINYIRIYHGDKTFSEYINFKAQTCKVREGLKVKAGQELATTKDPASYITMADFSISLTYIRRNKDKTLSIVTIPIHFNVNGKITMLKKGDTI